MIRNEFRFLGVVVGEIEELENGKLKFYVEVESKKSGRSTTYPIYVYGNNNRISKARLVNAHGLSIWVVGYVDNFENHLTLYAQNFIELICPR